MSAGDKPLIGVSSCLLGNRVRYDGRAELDGYIANLLAHHVEFVAFCPEVAIGLGPPGIPLPLAPGDSVIRALGAAEPDLDVTRQSADSVTRLPEGPRDLSGYILKSDPPSCGMQRVPVLGERRGECGEGMGVFATALMASVPWLPVEEEGRLADPPLRENFIDRVFTLYR